MNIFEAKRLEISYEVGLPQCLFWSDRSPLDTSRGPNAGVQCTVALAQLFSSKCQKQLDGEMN